MNNILRFLTLADKRNEKRFNDFMNLYKNLTDELPVKVRKAFVERKLSVCPATNKKYTISFTGADLVWWKEKFKNEYIVIRPIAEIKQAIKHCLLEIVDDYTRIVEEDDFEMQKLIENILTDK